MSGSAIHHDTMNIYMTSRLLHGSTVAFFPDQRQYILHTTHRSVIHLHKHSTILTALLSGGWYLVCFIWHLQDNDMTPQPGRTQLHVYYSSIVYVLPGRTSGQLVSVLARTERGGRHYRQREVTMSPQCPLQTHTHLQQNREILTSIHTSHYSIYWHVVHTSVPNSYLYQSWNLRAVRWLHSQTSKTNLHHTPIEIHCTTHTHTTKRHVHTVTSVLPSLAHPWYYI